MRTGPKPDLTEKAQGVRDLIRGMAPGLHAPAVAVLAFLVDPTAARAEVSSSSVPLQAVETKGNEWRLAFVLPFAPQPFESTARPS
jgi:hypothetical protein